MKLYIFSYTGDYCVGGIGVLAESKERALDLAIEQKVIELKYDELDRFILVYYVETSETEEIVVFNSYDCA